MERKKKEGKKGRFSRAAGGEGKKEKGLVWQMGENFCR